MKTGRRHYTGLTEWKNYFKTELADNLVKAVSSRNVDSVIEATKKLGQTCAKCHQDNELAVKLVYRFPSFEKVVIEDPVEFTELETGKYMEKLVSSLKAMKVYLLQGDPEMEEMLSSGKPDKNAVLGTLGKVTLSCAKCHNVHLVPAVVREAFEK